MEKVGRYSGQLLASGAGQLLCSKFSIPLAGVAVRLVNVLQQVRFGEPEPVLGQVDVAELSRLHQAIYRWPGYSQENAGLLDGKQVCILLIRPGNADGLDFLPDNLGEQLFEVRQGQGK